MTDPIPPISDVAGLPDGGRLFFGEWPGGAPPFVALHGLTNQHRNLAGVAAALDGALRVVAPDLRGRGASSAAPPESTIDRHADDVVALMDAVGIERGIVGGHSMGAYVATAVAAKAPERVSGLVLIDGGVMLSGEDDVEAVLDLVRPLLPRLTTTFGSPQEYLDHWRERGVFDRHWGPVVEQNLLYDLGRQADGYVPKADPRPVLEDLRDIAANDRASGRLASVRCPVLAIGAEHGMLGGADPILGDRELDVLRREVGDVELVRVPGTDHHTVAISDDGARACAQAIRAFAAAVG